MHHVKSEPRNQMQFYCLDQMVVVQDQLFESDFETDENAIGRHGR